MEKDNLKAMRTSRRSFLTKSAAGVVLASLPARSVWANGFNNGSIVASSHASSWVGENPIALVSPGKVKHSDSNLGWAAFDSANFNTSATFASIFGGTPLVTKNVTESNLQSATLAGVLDSNGYSSGSLAGKWNINVYLVEIYFNAVNHGYSLGGEVIHYPVLEQSQFADHPLYDAHKAFAYYLYQEASINPESVALDLAAILNNNHV
jgi:hypothetical protein